MSLWSGEDVVKSEIMFRSDFSSTFSAIINDSFSVNDEFTPDIFFIAFRVSLTGRLKGEFLNIKDFECMNFVTFVDTLL